MASSINARVQKHRDALRKAGLRPMQIWVPDTRKRGFAAECRRQSHLAARADEADAFLQRLASESALDVAGWTE